MIKWFNDNQGFMSAILSVIGVFISVIAIGISNRVSKKQDRIALFDKKFEVYKSLEDYFSNSKGWPNSVYEFLNPGSRLQKDNVWAPEINELVGKASLLFSEVLCEKLVSIKNKYSEIWSLDSSIITYFTFFDSLPNHQEIRPQFIEYLQNDFLSQDEEKKFEELCRKSSIFVNEQVAYGEFEPVVYNFYDLYKKQSDLYLEITKSEKGILEAIVGEIKPL